MLTLTERVIRNISSKTLTIVFSLPSASLRFLCVCLLEALSTSMSLNTNDKSSRRIHGPEPNELWPMTPQTRRTDIYIYAHNSTGNATYSLLQNILQWNITWHGKFVCNDMPLHTDGNRHKQKCITSSGITDIARWGINYLLHSAPPPPTTPHTQTIYTPWKSEGCTTDT